MSLKYKSFHLKNDFSLRDYLIPKDAELYLSYPLCGGGCCFDQNSNAARTFADDKNSDLISIVAHQNVEDNWNEIPKKMLNEKKKSSRIIQKATNWCKKNDIDELKDSIIGTIFCLINMVKFKKEKIGLSQSMFSLIGIN